MLGHESITATSLPVQLRVKSVDIVNSPHGKFFPFEVFCNIAVT